LPLGLLRDYQFLLMQDAYTIYVDENMVGNEKIELGITRLMAAGRQDSQLMAVGKAGKIVGWGDNIRKTTHTHIHHILAFFRLV